MKKQRGIVTTGVILALAFFGFLLTKAEPSKVECELPNGKAGYCDVNGEPLK